MWGQGGNGFKLGCLELGRGWVPDMYQRIQCTTVHRLPFPLHSWGPEPGCSAPRRLPRQGVYNAGAVIVPRRAWMGVPMAVSGGVHRGHWHIHRSRLVGKGTQLPDLDTGQPGELRIYMSPI